MTEKCGVRYTHDGPASLDNLIKIARDWKTTKEMEEFSR